LTATLAIGDIHKLEPSFFPRVSHLWVASWVLQACSRRCTIYIHVNCTLLAHRSVDWIQLWSCLV